MHIILFGAMHTAAWRVRDWAVLVPMGWVLPERSEMWRLKRHRGDLFVAAGQVMKTAIATNWHVAAAHTKT